MTFAQTVRTVNTTQSTTAAYDKGLGTRTQVMGAPIVKAALGHEVVSADT
ncbi:MAG: hypothetical protein H7293_04845 [Candidatus Saccharibacteria bacterium]|nr:hypothetical protein [Rhodoferax sp.]